MFSGDAPPPFCLRTAAVARVLDFHKRLIEGWILKFREAGEEKVVFFEWKRVKLEEEEEGDLGK